MPSIIAYRKIVTRETTAQPMLPEGATELCEIDGTTYTSLPDGAVMAENQPVEITAVTLDDTLRAAIKAASPHVRLINQRMIDRIRASYSIDDEFYFARIGVGAANGLYELTSDELDEMSEFGVFVESVRQWGREERSKLGL